MNHILFLRDSLVVKELGQTREDLKKQIKGLERFMNGTIIAY